MDPSASGVPLGMDFHLKLPTRCTSWQLRAGIRMIGSTIGSGHAFYGPWTLNMQS